ncbi:MAG: ComF family protein [Bacteroidales bacterium]|nr:ComF family protein [Bacteroidales bacterium]
MILIDDIIGLFFPRICTACEAVLLKNEETICTRCLFTLPRTNFHLHSENPVTELFWGRVPLQSATAYLYFAKAGRVQHLIHQFKYKGNLEAGRLLGKMYGNDLHRSELFAGVEAIVPVPLHWSKQKARGFNQSEVFGREMASAMNVPLLTDILFREKATATQTRKSRFDRWQNVSYVFNLTNPDKIAGKHILLVDDVVTTGATIEASASVLLAVPGVKISLAFLAMAAH